MAVTPAADDTGYLYEPPNSAANITPPVTTALQLLPFGSLDWDHFERLCLRLAERQGTVDYAGLYGVRGQKQGGIDVLVRLADGTYRCVQSRRIEALTPMGVRNAVTAFLNGEWEARTTEFVLATSASSRRAAVQEEVVKQADRLGRLQKKFNVWDQERLSGMLKAYPDLVRDFFGPTFRDVFAPEVTSITADQLVDDLAPRLESVVERLEATAPAPPLDQGVAQETADQLLDALLGPDELAPDLTEIFDELRGTSSREAAQLIAYVRGDPRRARGLIRTPQPWVSRGSSALWNGLGLLAIAAGDFSDAEAAFLRAEADAAANDRVTALVRANEAAIHAGHHDAAAAHFQRARDLDAAHVSVRLIEIGRVDSPEERLHQLAELQPRTPRQHLGVDRVHMDALVDLGQLEDALALAEGAVARNPNSLLGLDRRSGLTLLLATRALTSGSEPDATALRRAADDSVNLRERLTGRERPEETGQLLGRAAECLCLAGQTQRANELLDTVIDAELNEPETRRVLAQAMLHAGSIDRALGVLGPEEAWDPDDKVLAARALALGDGTKGHRRAADLAAGLLDDPERKVPAAFALVAAAAWDLCLPWPDEAAEILADEDPMPVAHMRAERLALEGRDREADEILRLHADDPAMMRALVERALGGERWGQALSLAEQLVDSTGRGDDRMRLARALHGSGQKERWRDQLNSIAGDKEQPDDIRSRAFAELSADLPDADYSALAALTDRWLRELPNDRRGVWHRAFALARLARHGEAYALLELHALDASSLNEARLLAEMFFRVLSPLEAARRIAELSDAFDREEEQLEALVFFAAMRTDEVPDPALRDRIADTVQQFPQRFPDSQTIRTVEIPEEPEGIVEVLRQQFDPDHAEHRERVDKQVAEGEAAVALLAAVTGRHITEVVPRLAALPLAYGDPGVAEREVEYAQRAIGGPAVWEPTALAVVGSLPVERRDAIVKALPGSVIAVSTLKDCDAAEAGLDDRDEHNLMAPDGEGLRVTHLDERQLQRERRMITEALELARTFTAVPDRDPEQPDPLDEVLSEGDVGPSFDSWGATISVARRRGLPVFSDDRFVRMGAQHEQVDAFGTEALARALHERGDVTEHELASLRLGLLRDGALGLRPTGDELARLAEEQGDQPLGGWLSALADPVGWRNDPDVRMRACLAMLREIWTRQPELLDVWTARVLDCAERALAQGHEFFARVMLMYTWIGPEVATSDAEHRRFAHALARAVDRTPRFLAVPRFHGIFITAAAQTLAAVPDDPHAFRATILRHVLAQLPLPYSVDVLMAFVTP